MPHYMCFHKNLIKTLPEQLMLCFIVLLLFTIKSLRSPKQLNSPEASERTLHTSAQSRLAVLPRANTRDETRIGEGNFTRKCLSLPGTTFC